MTEEIINSDGSRNWQANILLDNIKRLEQENFALTQESQQKSQTICELEQENKELKEEKLYRGIDRQFIEDANDRLHFEAEKYHKALEEIRKILNKECGVISNAKAVGIINEVLG